MVREVVVTDQTTLSWIVHLDRRLVVGSGHDADLALPGLTSTRIALDLTGPEVLVRLADPPADPRLLQEGQSLACGAYTLTLRSGARSVLAPLLDAEEGALLDVVDAGQEHEPPLPSTDRLLQALHGLAALPDEPSSAVVAAHGLGVVMTFTRAVWGAVYLPPLPPHPAPAYAGPAAFLASSGMGDARRLHTAAVRTTLAKGAVVALDQECHEVYLPLRASREQPVSGVLVVGAAQPLSSSERSAAAALCQLLARELGLAAAARQRRGSRDQGRLATILDALPDGVALVGHDGALEALNAPATRLLASFGQVPRGATTVLRTFSLGESVAEAFEGRPSQRRDVTAPDGTVIETLAAPLLAAGPSRGAVVVLRDVTEARRRDVDLREVLATVHDSVVATDGAGVIRLWNPAAERLFGYSPQEAVGRSVSMLLPRRYQELLAESRARSDAVSRVVGRTLELVGRRRDGAEFPLELTVGVAGTGERVTYTAIVRDITERKVAQEAVRRGEAQVRQACKMEAVGRLAGGIAHDFNNLLTVINGYGEALQPRLTLDPTALRYAAAMCEAGRRAAALTRQLLAFSRAQVVERTVLDLGAVVAATSDMLRRLLGEDVELDVRTGPGEVRVLAERGQLDQVVMNLAVNARDAMRGGGRLTIETAEVDAAAGKVHGLELAPGPWALLSVSDTGCGMDEATRARLFEPFFTTKPEGQGTGLGLSVVYGIVKQCDGHVAVSSQVEQGTRFSVYLPRATGTVEPATSSPSRGHALMGGAETVLLVEDDGAVRELVRAILEDNGYRVLLASDGSSALELLEGYRGDLDLVLTDLLMPKLNGLELSERLAVVRPEARVLFMSGYPDQVPAIGGQFLDKPFTAASLMNAVRAALDTRRAHDERP